MMAEEGKEGRPPIEMKRAAFPLAVMVSLIVTTIAISLVVGPLYKAKGLQAFGEEGATNPLIAVYYLVLIIVVTLIILLLRKLLKKRRLKLKYILAFAVGLSTFAVIVPLVDYAIYGPGPGWDETDIGVEGTYAASFVERGNGPPSLLVGGDGSVHLFVNDGNGLAKSDSIENPNNDIVFCGGWIVSGSDSWFVDGGEIRHAGNLTPPTAGASPITATEIVDQRSEAWLLVSWAKGTHRDLTLISKVNTTQHSGIEGGPVDFGISSGGDVSVAYHNDTVYLCTLTVNITGGALSFEELHTFPREIAWCKGGPDNMMVSAGGSLWISSRGGFEEVLPRSIASPSLAWASGEAEVVAIRGSRLYHAADGDFKTFGLDDEDNLAVHQDAFSGKITIVSGGGISTGYLPAGRMDLLVEFISLSITILTIGLLLWKPKWYLVDATGILMGAGVIALLGISLSILPVLLLLVLLAVYDYISVYRTKHMLALAESVVESKLPILLVFPFRWSYRYEDEGNILDRTRPREAMFMGLGDVVIPGILIVSASTFLSDSSGTALFGILTPSVWVSIFSLVGMLCGFSALMYFVLKGRPHAGLPLLNSGTILGFLLGQIVVYGTLTIL